MHCNFRQMLLGIVLFSFFSLKNEMRANDLFRRPESLAAVSGQTGQVQNKDFSIVKRLIAAYRLTASKNENRGNSMWQLFFDNRHKMLHNIFMGESLEKAAYVLRNPAYSDLFYGIDNLALSILPGFETAAAQQSYATICLDSLVRCAEAMGAIPLDNPEHYHYMAPIAWQTDDIVNKISQFLGVSIRFPNPYPQEYGLRTAAGIMSYRAPQALYQAYRIKQLLKGIENPRVLEIGAGLGRTPYYARLLGIKNYTIVDLPFTAMSSGYFLGCTLGEDQILYSGERAVDALDRIKILTPEEFIYSTDEYDLIINADGLTEMDPGVARNYWKQIEKRASIFLSMNHEVNSYRVKNLIDESEKILRVERYPYWMRKGYVEEIVRFK